MTGCRKNESSNPTTLVYKPIEPVHILTTEEKSLFPMKKGNTWNYSAETETVSGAQKSEGTIDLDFVMDNVRTDGQTRHSQISVYSSNRLSETQRWDLTDKGLFQVSAGADQVRYEPPQPFILFPTAQNESLTWVGSGEMADGKVGTSVTYIRILKPQITDIDGGSVTAVPVESHGFFKTANGLGYFNSTAWFQPRVGIVRIVQYLRQGAVQTRIIVRLRSANVGETE